MSEQAQEDDDVGPTFWPGTHSAAMEEKRQASLDPKGRDQHRKPDRRNAED